MTHALIPLGKGHFAIVDEPDLELLSGAPWSVMRDKHTNYAVRSVKREDGKWRNEYMHRVLVRGDTVDHRNGNGLDNRRENLRPATKAQNLQNIRRPPGASGFRGVEYYAKREKWRAHIGYGGKYLRLGYFDSAEDAATARDDKARELHGEFAVLNFPRPGERGVPIGKER